MSSTEFLEAPQEHGPRDASSRTAERLRLSVSATRMRAMAIETALSATNALADLARAGGSPAEAQAMAAVITRESAHRARNIDREVARLIATTVAEDPAARRR